MKSLNKTISTLVVGAILALLHSGFAANAQASTVTFKGGDIVANASPLINNNLTWAADRSTPIIGDGRVDFAVGQSIGTYTRPDTIVDPARFNQWLSSLVGDGLGISQFNLWLQDGNSNQAALWGETIALSDPYSSAITPFASSGWTASVYTLTDADGWGLAWTGRKLITYTANDLSNYLKPGTTAEFGFTADIMGNNGATGPDYQMWVGAGGANSDTGINQIVTQDGATYFQRAINAHVPDNGATLALLGVAFMGLAALRRRFVR